MKKLIYIYLFSLLFIGVPEAVAWMSPAIVGGGVPSSGVDCSTENDLQDFDNWTETDVGSDRLTVTSTKAELASVIKNETVTLVCDKGADNIGVFTYEFDFKITAMSDSATQGLVAVSNTAVSTHQAMSDAAIGVSVYAYKLGTDYRVYIQNYDGNSSATSDGLSFSTLYYATFIRKTDGGNEISLEIDNSADRASPEWSGKTITYTADTFRYVAVSFSHGGTGTTTSSGYVENLDMSP